MMQTIIVSLVQAFMVDQMLNARIIVPSSGSLSQQLYKNKKPTMPTTVTTAKLVPTISHTVKLTLKHR